MAAATPTSAAAPPAYHQTRLGERDASLLRGLLGGLGNCSGRALVGVGGTDQRRSRGRDLGAGHRREPQRSSGVVATVIDACRMTFLVAFRLSFQITFPARCPSAETKVAPAGTVWVITRSRTFDVPRLVTVITYPSRSPSTAVSCPLSTAMLRLRLGRIGVGVRRSQTKEKRQRAPRPPPNGSALGSRTDGLFRGASVLLCADWGATGRWRCIRGSSNTCPPRRRESGSGSRRDRIAGGLRWPGLLVNQDGVIGGQAVKSLAPFSRTPS